jgi:hypothetical protein
MVMICNLYYFLQIHNIIKCYHLLAKRYLMMPYFPFDFFKVSNISIIFPLSILVLVILPSLFLDGLTKGLLILLIFSDKQLLV